MSSKPSLSASSLANEIRESAISHVVSVPDYVQISLHQELEAGLAPRTIYTTSENEALEVAAGLHIGGMNPLVIMQNQGLYNSMNALRALGVDARLPLPLLVGQFGREFSNVGADPAASDRALVRNTERLVEALDLPCLRIEDDTDAVNLGSAISLAHERQCAVVALVGAHTTWE